MILNQMCVKVASVFSSMCPQFYHLSVFIFNIQMHEYILPMFKKYLGQGSFQSIIKVALFFMINNFLHIGDTWIQITHG